VLVTETTPAVTPIDSFALMQQHYGKGSYTVVAFSVRWCLPPFCFFFSVGSHQRLNVYKCALVGARCGCATSYVVVMCGCVEPNPTGRRVVICVDVPIQLSELFFLSFMFPAYGFPEQSCIFFYINLVCFVKKILLDPSLIQFISYLFSVINLLSLPIILVTK
jgi:hypothetical protein